MSDNDLEQVLSAIRTPHLSEVATGPAWMIWRSREFGDGWWPERVDRRQDYAEFWAAELCQDGHSRRFWERLPWDVPFNTIAIDIAWAEAETMGRIRPTVRPFQCGGVLKAAANASLSKVPGAMAALIDTPHEHESAGDGPFWMFWRQASGNGWFPCALARTRRSALKLAAGLTVFDTGALHTVERLPLAHAFGSSMYEAHWYGQPNTQSIFDRRERRPDDVDG